MVCKALLRCTVGGHGATKQTGADTDEHKGEIPKEVYRPKAALG